MLFQVVKNKVTIDLLAAANKYDLSELHSMCERELATNLNNENAVENFIAAFFHQGTALKKASAKFIVNNFDSIEEKSLLEKHPKAAVEIIGMMKGRF
jgi:hypothetical protein